MTQLAFRWWHWRRISGEFQAAVRDKVAEVSITGDQCDVVVDAGLGDERIGDSGFEPFAQNNAARMPCTYPIAVVNLEHWELPYLFVDGS